MKKPIFEAFSSPYPRLVEAVRSEIPIIDAADVTPGLILLAKNCLLKDPDLRLKMLQWRDFEPPEVDTTSLMDAKQRMLRRRALARQALDERGHTSDENALRLAQRRLIDVRLQVEEALRNECIGNDLFPQISIHSKPDGDANICTIVSEFSASPGHSLNAGFYFFLKIELIDVVEDVIRIQCAAVQYSSEPSLVVDHLHPLFEGVFVGNVVAPLVIDHLYLLFESVQDVDVSNANFPQWLSSTGEKTDNG